MAQLQNHPLEKFNYCPCCGSNNFIINNKLSRCCNDCGFVYYANPRAAVAAVITDEKGRILVARRAKDPARGTYDLPGGFTDCHETAEEALYREILEETGITIHSCKYLFSEPNMYTYSGIDIHTMDLFFWVEVNSDIEYKGQDDVASLEWINIADMDAEQFGLSSIKRGVRRIKKYFAR